MSWSELLRREIDGSYRVAGGLLDLVDKESLGWKPATGQNWMTTGQLLRHIASACGSGVKGFVPGDWGFPEGDDASEMKPEEMVPPAEKLPAAGSVAEARQELAADHDLALEMLGRCAEEDLAEKIATAPWDPTEMVLGHRLLQMVEHLKAHKAQLFYYLKLQGKDVNTGHLWGDVARRCGGRVA